MINFGHETEVLEFKKTTGELHDAIIDMAAILNKHDNGTLYFGVLPSGDVKGFQIVESTLRDVSRFVFEGIKPQIYPQIKKITIDGRDIIEVKFSGRSRPYSAYGKYYIRVADESRDMTPDELKNMMLEKSSSDKWERKETDSTIGDVDVEMLKSFYDRATACGRLPADGFDPEHLLKKLGLFNNGKLNNAGNSLFGKTGPVTLKLAVFATDEKLTFLDIDRKEDNIFRLVDIAMSYVKRNIRWRAEINGLYREEIPEIPMNALREIIVNSFVHAEYGVGVQHELDVHPGKVVVFNPGAFPDKLSPRDFADRNLSSIIRNELIAKVMYLCHDIESFGSGFKRVFSSCEAADVKCGYDMLHYGFSFIFYRDDPYGGTEEKKAAPPVPDNLTAGEAKVYDMLKEQPNLTREEIAVQMDRSVKTVQRILNSLKEKELIVRVGTNIKGYWDVR